jgi:hypothetical protein
MARTTPKAEQKSRAITRKAKYKAENPEFVVAQRSAISARYREKHPEKARESLAKYRAANLDWNKAATPERERIRGAKYRAANSQACNERTAKFRAMNPDQGRSYGKRCEPQTAIRKMRLGVGIARANSVQRGLIHLSSGLQKKPSTAFVASIAA